ncbi:MAG TPA: protein kinase [Chthoniobacterales bacterium]|nr:protein kinase [Chthoniobacterales bacterium]
MKAFSPGLSDSIASVVADPRPCPHCDSSSHIAGGLCVGCLLEAGLDPIDESESGALTDLLAEINLPDQNWRLGNYEILEEIGRGGMGVIYRARQRHSRRIVAVKRVLSYHSDSRETLARFRREAQAAASLDHPNILPIYEVSESEDGLPFFSMKFAPGGTLQQVAPALRNEPRQCVALVAKIARAVQYAHSKGILHRDLKPGNILLDGRAEPLVSDFGLAKWLDTTSDLTRTLTIFGTPGYIAPEQASNAAADLKPTADVYSLGAILFDLLAGRPPFLGAHALSVIRQAAESPAPKLRTLSKLADRDLETICSRCLERDPKLRYPSAHDLAEDLERWLEGRPIIARPVSPPAHLWRWIRRNPVLTGAGLACIMLMALAVVRQIGHIRLEETVRDGQRAARSIGVLPFLNLDTVERDEQGSQHVIEFLKAELSLFAPVQVTEVPTSETAAGAGSGRVIMDAGRKAQTRSILTGTTRTVNGRQRLSLRMMDSATGEVLLGPLTIDTQRGVDHGDEASSLARQINTILATKDWSGLSYSRRDPALRNDTSRELIAAGRDLMLRVSVADLDRAIECFRKALLAEPDSAIAHAYLASAANIRVNYASDARIEELGEREAREAIRLRPDSADARRALAGLLFRKGRRTEALEELMKAVEISGPDENIAGFIGTTLGALGQPSHALAWLEMAKYWGERPSANDSLIGDCWADLGDDSRAETAYRRSSDLHPEMPQGWMGICHLRLLEGSFDAARALYKENRPKYSQFVFSTQIAAQVEFFGRNYSEAERLYRELVEIDPEGGDTFWGAISYQSALANLRQHAGDEIAARAILESCLSKYFAKLKQTPNDAVNLYVISALESSVGQKEESLEHLRAATAAGWTDYRSLQLDPRFDLIAHDPRFKTVVSEIATKVEILRRQTVNHLTNSIQ